MLLKLIKLLWAGPNTLLALLIAVTLWLCSVGAKSRRNQVTFRLVDGVIEVHGGLVADVLRGLPTSGSWRKPAGAAAMTLGHVVLGIDQAALNRTRIHERVHVRQYERWGPLFVPAYLVATLIAKAHGQHGYLANRFEREAYAVSHPERDDVSRSA